MDPYIGMDVGLSIWDNPELTSLDGLQGLTTIGGDLDIDSNDQLTSLDGLQGLTSIVDSSDCQPCTGEIEIKRNPSLLSLDALESLQEVDGCVSVKQNENV